MTAASGAEWPAAGGEAELQMLLRSAAVAAPVQAPTEDAAIERAQRYLFANIYPLRAEKIEVPPDGKQD